MYRRMLFIAVALVAAVNGPSHAELCAIDAVPAATILVPYFEVDLSRFGTSKFENTEVTLINTFAAPVIAHVIFWTDLSVPVLNFDVFLTGYDKHVMDIDRLFTHGALPIPPTTDNGNGSGCTSCSESGCVNISPSDDFTLQDLINAHTGQPVDFYSGQCMGRRLGNGRVARGYITIDNVNACTRLFPGDSGYFENGGNGIANNINVLQATIRRYSKKFLSEVPAISIEAGTSDGLSTPGNYTFYGRYNGFDASDNRECGAIAWGIPWQRNSGFKTEAIVWRDSGFNQGPFDCQAGPSWLPLSQFQIVVFDDQEDSQEITGEPFPAETQKVEVGKRPLNASPFNSGWLYMGFSDAPEAPAYVIANQLFRKREGEAIGTIIRNTDSADPGPLFDTICGQPVSPEMLRRAQRDY